MTYNFAFIVNNLCIHIVNKAKILAVALYQSISIHKLHQLAVFGHYSGIIGLKNLFYATNSL